jgi:hypothetical protein
LILDNCKDIKPLAALVNSGNLGYARAILDERSIGYFLKNISKVKS